MQVDKTWFSSLSSFRAVNSSSCYHCEAIVNILESRPFFVQEAVFKRTSPSLLFIVMFLSHQWTMNKLLKVSLALVVLLCKCFVLERATLLRIGRLNNDWIFSQVMGLLTFWIIRIVEGRWSIGCSLTCLHGVSQKAGTLTSRLDLGIFPACIDRYHMRTQVYLLLPGSR